MLDNGAFSDWRAGRDWDERAWLLDLEHAAADSEGRPEFVVAPDAVGSGLTSLRLSVRWLPRIRASGLQAYLAVQDGMTAADVRAGCEGFAGLFVGGTLPWKLHTAHAWTDLAHELGLLCHVGRVGGARRVRWAREIGADSIDSSLPLWSRENLRVFLAALGEGGQRMFGWSG